MRRIVYVVLVVVALASACRSQADKASKREATVPASPTSSAPPKLAEVDPSTPVLVGPADAQFWASLRAASALLDTKPIPAAMTEFRGTQWQAQTKKGDRFVIIEQNGKREPATLVAKAGDRYCDLPSGDKVRPYHAPVEGAPHIGTGNVFGGYYQLVKGRLVKVGSDDKTYRKVAGENLLMTRAAADGEPFMAIVKGKIYRLEGEKIVEVGEGRYAVIKPSSSSPPPPVPILVSRLSGTGARWAGEFGGRLYVEE